MKKARIAVVALAVLMLFAAVSCKDEPVHQHVFDKQVVEEKYLAEKATEESPAKYYLSCECGEKSEETFKYGDPLPPAHKHSYSTEWKSNADNHWHVCECGAKTDEEKHTLEVDKDGTNHWKKCSVCGYKTEGVAHVYGAPQVKGDKVVHVCEECAREEEIKGAVAVGTEDALFAAVKNGVRDVYLSKDIILKKTLFIDGDKEITLHMNDKKIAIDVTETTGGLITVVGNAKLTVTGNGRFTYTEEYYNTDLTLTGYFFTVKNDAQLTILDGNYDGVMGCIQIGSDKTIVEKASVFIKGGSFKSVVLYSGHYWTLNKIDGTSASFVVSGGEFASFDPSNGKTENPPENFLAEGYKTTSKDVDGITWWTVEKN